MISPWQFLLVFFASGSATVLLTGSILWTGWETES